MASDKKEPKAPSEHTDKKDKLENKDQKNADLKPAGLNDIGESEYEEYATDDIRMKPQPLEKDGKDKQQTPPDRESDGL